MAQVEIIEYSIFRTSSDLVMAHSLIIFMLPFEHVMACCMFIVKPEPEM